MKSWRFHEFGNIKNLQLEEIPIPKPEADEALIQINCAGLNPADIFTVMGRYPGVATPPFSVGRDGCGTIVKPGKSGRFKEGDKVVLLRSDTGIKRDGTLAEYVCVPEASLAAKPYWLNDVEAAAAPLVLLTNWQALSIAARLQPGENVLITGASGGIGTSAIILAKAMGATVIALSRSETKRAELTKLGADHVFDTEEPELKDKTKALGGIDVIIENICGDSLDERLKLLNKYGRVCIIGALGGIKSQINPLTILFNRLQIHGIQVGDYQDKEVQEAWRGIVSSLEADKKSVPVDKVFPFDQVQEAFDHMRHGPMGKVVIQVKE